MDRLTLVDLESQQDAVLAFVKDWKTNDILDWMRQYGAVTQNTDPYGSTIYVFRSRTGKQAGFRFTDNGDLFIIRTGWSMY